MTFNHLAILDPGIKFFISVMAIVGPLAIGILLLILKKIEDVNPDKVRWR